MNFSECIHHIHHWLGLDSYEETIRVAGGSVAVIADCLPGTLTEELAARLPPELADDMRRPAWQPGERLSLSELVGRIAARDDVSDETARHRLGVVLNRLMDDLPDPVRSRLLAELPEGAGELTGDDPAPAPPRMHQAVS